MEDLAKLKTQVALLQKDAKTGEQIHQRLEVAIEKLTDITVSLTVSYTHLRAHET